MAVDSSIVSWTATSRPGPEDLRIGVMRMEYAAFLVPINQEAITAVNAVPPEANVLTKVN